MGENEIFETTEIKVQVEPETAPVPLKPKKPKAELTAERKAELLDRLRKGKEKAKAKREAAKKAAKQEEGGGVKAALVASAGDGALLDEMRAMRQELQGLRADKAERRKAKAAAPSLKAEPKPVPEYQGLSQPPAAAPPAPAKPPAAAAPPAPVYEERWDARNNKVVRRRIR